MNDPIASLLTQIRNALQAGHESVTVPASRIKHEIAKKLLDGGYISKLETVGEAPKTSLLITLKYVEGSPIVTHIKRISKPSVRIYAGKKRIPKSLSGRGITLLTTSKGILTDKEARAAGIGGEIICQIW
ncbi:30S ribosomal protein S8 [Candidatus Collierbacteria bacterium RIFOXYB1_FULL_49_13]|uniref:Small ribosomal subunit protein uS8 n=1 Tax=Candidatus Collierbacteria bacterium RIFOXYB1_FULL_49_13 TaxID=1817728 RepID=A0A1F5FHK0_9BACT|nr:ribosomal protein S8 [uncultured bacterium]OGD79125.1 MAG: 30S ribosomal protein S8 [Candidatus Collierbacteria bacterium RIFOXYB1_FULL_49_13]